jgi:hypothetical protein
MADVFELVALALPGEVALESLPATVRQFVKVTASSSGAAPSVRRRISFATVQRRDEASGYQG